MLTSESLITMLATDIGIQARPDRGEWDRMMSARERRGNKKRLKRAETEAPSDSEAEDHCERDSGTEEGVTDARGTPAAEQRGKKKGAGSFQTMGLLPPLLRAIQRKGFRLPTPIQRKCIPPLLDGRDVVGMARTGSGKTAAFLLPLLQSLRAHSLKVGVRGLILSPSRELALQTFSVLRELAKFTDLRSIVLVGGEGVEEHFAQLATNPDIVVATPGRLMHLCVETKLSLREVSFVVWDEADRLMEDPTMAQQIREINARLPETRQTALFSATLPKALAEFAQAGLQNPLLVRLDVDTKLSPDLTMSFVQVQSETKDALLLLLLQRILATKAGGKPQLTVVFAATKHHVEYLQELLGEACHLPCTYVYGALDQTARKMAIDQFRSGRKQILIVTDVAARGIDIPLLDNVINYDFPSTPKLFVHRVGRVARAGRSGHAYSLVSPDEIPYLFDLQLFLGTRIVPAASVADHSKETLVLGTAPQKLVDEEQELLAAKHRYHGTLPSLKGVMNNAYKLYRRTRPAPSPESHRRSKDFCGANAVLGIHPMFVALIGEDEMKQSQLVQAIQQYRPKNSHLSLGVRPVPAKPKAATFSFRPEEGVTAPSSRDESHYLSYTRENAHGDESAYSLTKKSFAEQARSAVFDLTGTSSDDPRDRKSRKGSHSDRNKLVKTELGTLVAASFRSDAYDKWRAKTHLDIQQPGEMEMEAASNRARAMLSSQRERSKWRHKKPTTRPGKR